MEMLDIKNWKRRDIYKVFRAMQFPHFSLTTELDVTAALKFARETGVSSYSMMLYLTCRCGNEVPAFHLRLRPEGVIRHCELAIAPTTGWKYGLYNFTMIQYTPDPVEFFRRQAEQDAMVMELEHLNLEGDRKIGDACLFSSCVPWFSFTGLTQPAHNAEDSIPRIVWGKYTKRGRRTFMPISLQCHHAVTDGHDVADFLDRFQQLANDAPKTFASLLKH